MKTIEEFNQIKPDISLDDFSYQKRLTVKLDELEGDFDQDIINEIVLWKVNRYAFFSQTTIDMLNSIDKQANLLDEDYTRKVLKKMLDTKGVQLPMASTILRFKNPNIYQIIDQRVYRYLYGKEIKYPYNKDACITMYVEYLKFLKLQCKKNSIPFCDADRIFYIADKKQNKNSNLKNY